MGITALVASIPGNYQGFESADEIAYVDITDPEAVLQAAGEDTKSFQKRDLLPWHSQDSRMTGSRMTRTFCCLENDKEIQR